MIDRAVVFLLILVILFKLPTIGLPAHHDELGYFHGVDTVLKNDFNPFVEHSANHPPLILEIAAFFLKISDGRWSAIAVLHLIIIAFAAAALIFTYRLGKELFGRRAGITAAILLFFNPLFSAHSGMFDLEIPLTVAAVALFYYYFKADWRGYFLSGVALVMIKETGVLIIFFLVLLDLFKNFPRIRSFSGLAIRAGKMASPLIVFFIWMILNKIFLGWWLKPLYLSFYTSESFRNIDSEKLLRIAYVDQSMWLVYLLAVVALVLYKESFWVKGFFLLAIVSPWWFYLGQFLPRYILFSYPFIFLIAAVGLEVACKKAMIKAAAPMVATAAVIVFIFLFETLLSLFSPKLFLEWSGERNIGYIRYIAANKEAIKWIEENVKRSTPIVSLWPLSYILFEEKLGYLNAPGYFPVKEFADCERLKKGELAAVPVYLYGSVKMNDFERCLSSRGKLVKVFNFDFQFAINENRVMIKLYRLEK